MTPDQLQFEQARKLYPGSKSGFGPEYKNFLKQCKKQKWNAKEILPLLLPAIVEQMRRRRIRRGANVWTAEWRHFPTWINNQGWTTEIPLPEGYKPRVKAKSVPRPKPQAEHVQVSEERLAELRKGLPGFKLKKVYEDDKRSFSDKQNDALKRLREG